jgi:hypothetical protein
VPRFGVYDNMKTAVDRSIKARCGRNNADAAMIASHERLFDRGQVSFGWQHYIPFIEGDLRRHSNGDRIMMQVLAAVPIAGFDPVLVAVKRVLESGSLNADHILNVLARLPATAPPPLVETSLQLKMAPVAAHGEASTAPSNLRTSTSDQMRLEVLPDR